MTAIVNALYLTRSDASAGRSKRPDSSPEPSPPAQKCLVLIVEDDVTTASALRSILMRKNCGVIHAATLDQGLRALSQRPSYVILDLMLPDGDGLEILRRLQTAAIPTRVVVTTSVVDADRMRQVQALSPHRILRKPLDLVDLLSAIGMM